MIVRLFLILSVLMSLAAPRVGFAEGAKKRWELTGPDAENYYMRQRMERERSKKGGAQVHRILEEDKSIGVSWEEQLRYLEGLKESYEQFDAVFRYSVALPIAERALAVAEELFGADAQELLAILDDSAEYNYERRFFDRAFALASRSLKIKERVFGPYHPEVAVSLSRMAVTDHMWDRLGGQTCKLKAPIVTLDRVSDISLVGPPYCERIQGYANRAERIRRQEYGLAAGGHIYSVLLVAWFDMESGFLSEAGKLRLAALRAHKKIPGADPKILSLLVRRMAVWPGNRQENLREVESTIAFTEKRFPYSRGELAVMLQALHALSLGLEEGEPLPFDEQELWQKVISLLEAEFGEEFLGLSKPLSRLMYLLPVEEAISVAERIVLIEEKHLPYGQAYLDEARESLSELRAIAKERKSEPPL